ncbi:MAG: hypothetical protein ACRDZX_01255 [Acidimicrobiales bacterium]
MRKMISRLGACALVAVLALAGPGAATALAGAPPTSAGSQLGVGVYPTTVTFNHALRDGEYIEDIGILSGPSPGEWFHFKLSGAAAPWLRVTSATGSSRSLTRLWLPNDVTRARTLLLLRVPSTVANGSYGAKVEVFTVPAKSTSKKPVTVGITGSVGITVDVTGSEVVAGALVNAYTYPKIEVGEPLRVFAVVKNSSNVAVQPKFDLQVAKAAGQAPAYTWSGSPGANAVLPGLSSTYEVDWPARSTKEATLGAYVAKVTAIFPGGKKVGSWKLPFKVYPYGYLHRGGELLSLELANHPRAGYLAEVKARVKSTGEVQQETTFVGQLYRDGTLLRQVKSPVPTLLAPSGQVGSTGVITVPLPVAKDGLYHLVGMANFAGAQSKSLVLTFRVGSASAAAWYEIGAAAAVLGVVLVALLVRRRRRPPSARQPVHTAPKYAPAHPRTLHVPPRTPVGSSPGRPSPPLRRS